MSGAGWSLSGVLARCLRRLCHRERAGDQVRSDSAGETVSLDVLVVPGREDLPVSTANPVEKVDLLTTDQLRAIMPRCDVAVWHPLLVPEMSAWGIITTTRWAAFLAQIAHESDECRRLEENLSYTAERLLQVWPARFRVLDENGLLDEARSLAKAKPYARAPEALANYVYAKRLGNGDAGSGDGWRYRGGGLIQLTGLDVYVQAQKDTGLDLLARPEQIRVPGLPAAKTACWFWRSRGCNDLADALDGPAPEEAFRRLTRRINGALTGLEDRRAYWVRARAVLV